MAMSNALRVAAFALLAWPAPGLRRKFDVLAVDPSPHFTDEAAVRRTGRDGRSFGVAMADVDGDGDLDVFVASSESSNVLLLNTDGKGKLEDATANSGLADAEAPSRGAAFADVNGDGKLDLFVTAYGSPNRLWIGDGAGHFTDTSAVAGVSDWGHGQGACFADVDGDGDLDLFVANFGESDRMYLNDGNGSFADVTATAGVQSDGLRGFGCVFADVDEDGDLDLYVNNDGAFNRLYINDGQGVFTDRTWWSGAAATAGGGRAVQAADFNGDGHLDLFAVVATGSNTYLLGRGDGTFIDATLTAGLASQRGIAQGMNVADIDGDGDLDILVTVLNAANTVYENDGTGKFRDITSIGGAGAHKFGQGLAFGDLDDDGRLDGYLASWGPAALGCPSCSAADAKLMNQHPVQAWLKVRPLGSKLASIPGTEVRVFEAGTSTLAAALTQIDGGSGFGSQNAQEAYFGLSKAFAGGSRTFDVRVSCRSGAPATVRNVVPNQTLEVQC